MLKVSKDDFIAIHSACYVGKDAEADRLFRTIVDEGDSTDVSKHPLFGDYTDALEDL